MKEGIVGGEAFTVERSIIVADAHRRRGVAKIEDLDPTSNRIGRGPRPGLRRPGASTISAPANSDSGINS